MSVRFVVIPLTALAFALLAVLVFVLLPQRAVADDECVTASGHMVSCGVALSPADICSYPHFHGTLDGSTDPLGECGHGALTPLPHEYEPEPESPLQTPIFVVDTFVVDTHSGETFYSVFCVRGPPDGGFGEALSSGDLSLIFADGFESGDTSAWSATVPRTISGSGAASDGSSMNRRLAPAPDVNGRSPAEEHEEPSFCDRVVAFFTDRPDPVDWASAGLSGVTGGFGAKEIYDSVDILVEAAPSIKAKIDTVDQWEEQHGVLPHRKPFKSTPGPTLHQRFWGPLANVIFYFWDN